VTVDEGKDGFPSPFGRYTLTERLATGGMAEVFKAKITSAHGFEKLLVIKRILPQLAADRNFVSMFIDEAKLTAQLIHPKIVQVIDFGEVKGQYFIALEYIDGVDALALLRSSAGKQVRVPMPVCMYIAMEVLDALDYAHNARDGEGKAMRLVHRDISPSNVFLARRGDVKLGDFGIAHAQERESKTQAGTLKGKYGYMSPEQVMGTQLDGRSDLFAVGIVLAEMLMGRRLFSAPNDLDVLLMVRDGRLDRLDKYARDLPPALNAIVRKALARKVGDRFQNAGEFRDALADLLFQSRMRIGASDLGRILSDFLDPSAEATTRLNQESKRWDLRAAQGAPSDEMGLRAPLSAAHSQPMSGLSRAPSSGGASASASFRRPGTSRSGTPAPASREGVAPAEIAPASGSTEELDIDLEEPASSAPEEAAKLAAALSQPLAVVDLDKYEAPGRSSSKRTSGTSSAPAPTATADLATVSPMRIFGDLAVGGESGLLRLETPPHTRDLYWASGAPVAFTSTLPSERFAEGLVAGGVVRPETMQTAQRQVGRFGGRLGEALAALGLIPSGDVARLLSEYVRARAIAALAINHGRVTFFRNVSSPEEPAPLPLDAFEILGAGVLLLPLETFRQRFGAGLDQRPMAVAPPRLDPELFRLGPTPRELWSVFDGGRSVRDWLGSFASSEEQLTFLRTLYLLTETGLVRLG
jgi:eukaryotic-like serine/threonine-protein kinase